MPSHTIYRCNRFYQILKKKTENKHSRALPSFKVSLSLYIVTLQTLALPPVFLFFFPSSHSPAAVPSHSLCNCIRTGRFSQPRQPSPLNPGKFSPLLFVVFFIASLQDKTLPPMFAGLLTWKEKRRVPFCLTCINIGIRAGFSHSEFSPWKLFHFLFSSLLFCCYWPIIIFLNFSVPYPGESKSL